MLGPKVGTVCRFPVCKKQLKEIAGIIHHFYNVREVNSMFLVQVIGHI